MPRRLIDISVALQAGIASDPANMLPKIDYVDHHMSAPRMADYMGVRLDQLPERSWPRDDAGWLDLASRAVPAVAG